MCDAVFDAVCACVYVFCECAHTFLVLWVQHLQLTGIIEILPYALICELGMCIFGSFLHKGGCLITI